MNHPVQLQVEHPRQTERIHVVTRLALPAGLRRARVLRRLLGVVSGAAGGGRRRAHAKRGRALPGRGRSPNCPGAEMAGVGLRLPLAPHGRSPNGRGEPRRPEDRGRRATCPTPTSALLRLVFSLPALVLLALLSAAAGILWVVGAVLILIRKQLPGAIADILTFTLRFQFQLVAYHLSLVERYPSIRADRVAHAAA